MATNELAVDNLWQNPRLLESVFCTLPLAVSIISFPDFSFKRVNSEYCSRLKNSPRPDDVQGRRVEEFFSPSQEAVDAMRAAHYQGSVTHFKRFESKHFGHKPSFWNVTIAPFRKARDQTFTIGFMADVTQAVEFEEKLRRQRDELLESFFHELRTPLTAVKSMNHLIQKKLPDLSREDLEHHLKALDSYTSSLASGISELGRFDPFLKRVK